MLEPLDRCRRDGALFQLTNKRLRDFIDPNHLLIQIDEQLDFAKLVAHLEQRYCPDFGGPAVYPEAMARAFLICSICNIANAQEAPPNPAFLRNGHGDSATPLASPAGANHSDQRWATTLKSLDSRAADEEDQAGITGGSSAALTPASVPPAQTNLPAEGGMEGNSESHAQGDVAAGDREGVGNPQGHHQEIHGCRRSSRAAVPACSHCVNIRYSGAITKLHLC